MPPEAFTGLSSDELDELTASLRIRKAQLEVARDMAEDISAFESVERHIDAVQALLGRVSRASEGLGGGAGTA